VNREETHFKLGVVTVGVTTTDGHTYLEDWDAKHVKDAQIYASETSMCSDVSQVVFTDNRVRGCGRIVFGG